MCKQVQKFPSPPFGVVKKFKAPPPLAAQGSAICDIELISHNSTEW
jgi:hypothetical protein